MGATTNNFVYDGAGDLLTLTDGKNQSTDFGYDAFGRVTNKVDAVGNILFVYQYDPDNRLTNRWSNAKGNTIYQFDAVGNLTGITYPVSPAISLQYDALNRLTNMVDAVGTTVYSYDAAGQLLSEGGLWPSDTVSYTYQNRLRTGLTLAQPDATPWSQGYGYDNERRLQSLTSPAGGFNYTYDATRKLHVANLSLPNGAYITNTFDSVARLTGTTLDNSGGTALDSYAYGYNQAGQRTNVVRTAGDFVAYTYDNIGELKTANGREAGGVTNRLQEQFGYLYDAAGNLNSRTNNALVQAFNVNQLNELTNIIRSGTFTVAGLTTTAATNVTVNTANAVQYADFTFVATNFTLTNGNNTFTAVAQDSLGDVSTNVVAANLPATNSYVYDLNGNLRTNGLQILNYDDENELTNVYVTNAWRCDFVYDGKFRRRIEWDYGWSGSSWTQTNEIHFIYDGNVVIEERNTNNVPVATYTRSGGSLLARSDHSLPPTPYYSVHSYYHTDGNGNVTMLINAGQVVVAKYEYDPFLNVIAMSGPMAPVNLYRGASKEWNAQAGLYYFGRRFYDPNLQRFVNRDPLQEHGGLNLYGYCGNNPVSLVDLLGLCPTLDDPLGPLDDPDSPFYNPLLDPYNPDSPFFNPPVNPFTGQPNNVSDFSAVAASDPNNLSNAANNWAASYAASTTSDPNTSSTGGNGNNGIIGSASTGLGIAGISQFAGEYGAGAASIGNNWKFYPHFYGNKSVPVTMISDIAHYVGYPLAVASVLTDALNPQVSRTQFNINTGVTAIGLLGGNFGASFSVGYGAGSLIQGPANGAVAFTFQIFTDIYYHAPLGPNFADRL